MYSASTCRASSRRKWRNSSVMAGRLGSRCRSEMNNVVMPCIVEPDPDQRGSGHSCSEAVPSSRPMPVAASTSLG
ncbi:hypothetical protein D3C78_1961780 [compost metagenome]